MSSDAQEENSVVYIGKKPAMNYVLVITTVFSKGSPICTIKARGKAISKAVDVADITLRRFLADTIELKDVKIGSELVERDEKERNVSTIEIVLGKKDDPDHPPTSIVTNDSYEQTDENTVFIGRKSAMNYTLVCVTIFNKGHKHCVIRARGKSIGRAIDVADITRKRFLAGAVDITAVKISSEEVEGENGPRTVSTIDVVLEKLD